MTAQPYIPPRLASALALAAMAVQGSRGRKRMDAEDKLGRVLLAINGAPFGFQGVLTPDRPPWPLPGVDPIITAARAEFDPPEEPGDDEPDYDGWSIGDRAGAWDAGYGDRGEIVDFADGKDADGYALAVIELDFGGRPTVSVQSLSILTDDAPADDEEEEA